MTTGLVLTLGERFKQVAGIYVNSFPRAYVTSLGKLVEITSPLRAYQSVIANNRDAIFRAAAAEINKYLNNYSVHANQSADEFKLIYFLGRSIERHLLKDGYPELARAHMFCMVGLLDFRLQTMQIFKPTLTKALTRLIKLNIFQEELGNTGCYLTYKCVATVKATTDKSSTL